MEKETKNGLSFLTILGLIFLVLKLVPGNPVNGWAWIWVLSPFWIPFAIIFVILAIAIIGALTKHDERK